MQFAGLDARQARAFAGFLNHWHASIPVGERVVEATGVCTVQLRQGLIYSNRVFFDRSALLEAIRSARSGSPSGFSPSRAAPGRTAGR